MSSSLNLKVDLSDVMAQARGIINAEIMPRLAQAVSAVAQQGAIDWKESVTRAKLWTGEKVPYADSITWKMTGDFSAVIETEYKLASEIENGRPAYDMKRMLDTSLKVRTTKSGKRYLIIPFRHNTPGNNAHGQAMPASVYKLARQLAPSRIVATQVNGRKSGLDASDIRTRGALYVNKNMYAWGDRLSTKGQLPKLKQRSRYEGMYRFETSSGGSTSSAFLTFRVMMEGSPKWIVAARPGLFLAKGVVDRLGPLANQAFAQAVKLDLGG